jgi:hypothetical protein
VRFNANRSWLDGMLWVRRTTPAGAAPLFDVIDRNGALAGRIVLPARSLLLGHGPGVSTWLG